VAAYNCVVSFFISDEKKREVHEFCECWTADGSVILISVAECCWDIPYPAHAAASWEPFSEGGGRGRIIISAFSQDQSVLAFSVPHGNFFSFFLKKFFIYS
jgi:hypothetical protein